MGEKQEIYVNKGTTLRECLNSVDNMIEETSKIKGVAANQLGILNISGSLNSCIVAVNGQTPSEILDYKLQNGDCISLIYGYCGG
jgi:methionine aminopeptidase